MMADELPASSAPARHTIDKCQRGTHLMTGTIDGTTTIVTCQVCSLELVVPTEKWLAVEGQDGGELNV